MWGEESAVRSADVQNRAGENGSGMPVGSWLRQGRRRMTFCAVLCALSAAFLPALASAEAPPKVISLVTDPEKRGGFLLEITREAFARVGYQIDVSYGPWVRVLGSVETGESQGLLGSAYSLHRAENLFYTDMIAESPTVVFQRAEDRWRYREPDDLKGKTIGLITRSLYPGNILADPEIRKEFVSSYQQNIDKLILGRLDAVIEKQHIVEEYLETLSPDKRFAVIISGPPLAMNRYYNAFAKATPDGAVLRDAFNHGLSLLKADGRYDQIMVRGLHE